MAFQSISMDDKLPIFYALYQAGVVSQNLFSFYLGSVSGAAGSVMQLGYSDAATYC
jgi:hypothetical protein